jgi:hypothetical protein
MTVPAGVRAQARLKRLRRRVRASLIVFYLKKRL